MVLQNILSQFIVKPVIVSSLYRFSFFSSVLTQIHCGLLADRRLSWSGVKMIRVENRWQGGLTAGEGSWWGWEAACVEEFDRKGLECSCPWSGVNPPPSSYDFLLLLHHLLSLSMMRINNLFYSWWSILAAPCPRISCKRLVNIANHKVCFT